MKLISIYKSIQSSFFLAAALSSPCFADYYDYQSEPDYQPYLKIAVGRVLNQPKTVKTQDGQHKIDLFVGDDYNYQIEMGISVIPVNSRNEFHLGLAVVDLLAQGKTSQNYSPYKFEVFGDYVKNFRNNFYTSLGVGFKIASATEVVFVNGSLYDPNKKVAVSVNESYLDKVTARISIGKRFKYYNLSLDHHSQYLVGAPFSDDFEYHVTALTISHTF
jgi:hypothetical protein